MEIIKPIFDIYMPKFTNYINMKNYPADFGLNPFSIFISYLVFCHSNSSKVSYIQNVTSMYITFKNKIISNSIILRS